MSPRSLAARDGNGIFLTTGVSVPEVRVNTASEAKKVSDRIYKLALFTINLLGFGWKTRIFLQFTLKQMSFQAFARG
jgi:hypothetical protein